MWDVWEYGDLVDAAWGETARTGTGQEQATKGEANQPPGRGAA